MAENKTAAKSITLAHNVWTAGGMLQAGATVATSKVADALASDPRLDAGHPDHAVQRAKRSALLEKLNRKA